MFALIFSSMSPMTTLFSTSSMSFGTWGMVIVPFVIMLVMMFFVFRWMTGQGVPMSGMMHQRGLMSKMMGKSHALHAMGMDANLTTLTYNIPSVSCAHCKIKIEHCVSKLPGVSSVNVDVGTKQATITYTSPATIYDIQKLLEEIGYPPVI